MEDGHRLTWQVHWSALASAEELYVLYVHVSAGSTGVRHKQTGKHNFQHIQTYAYPQPYNMQILWMQANAEVANTEFIWVSI